LGEINTNVQGGSGDVLRAAEVLYEIDELDLVLTFVSELAETSVDVATLVELIARHHDAQVMLIMGKTAVTTGLSTERYAFPEIGVPAYNALTGATLRQPMQPG
jgi:hypothetical protein